MAQGDSKQFHDYPLRAGNGNYNNGADTFKVAFLSNTYSTIDNNTVNPKLADFTQVTGGSFAGPVTLTSRTWTRSSAITKLDFTNLATIVKNASNPTTIRTMLVYNDTSTNDDAYQVFDLTADGTTAIDVVNNDFDFSFSASGAMTGTANV